jgi:hypothetical protein
MIAKFKDLHTGEPVCIMANGASILDHDLSRVSCKTIGTNRSWELLWPTYHVIVDSRQETGHDETYRKLASEGRLFVSGECFKRGHKISFGGGSFSRDLSEGVVISLDGIGSVAYVALQIAAYMGFRPIYFLGLDLGGPHFHKEWDVTPIIERQNELFAHTPSDLEVFNVGSPESRCSKFPKMAFGEVWPEAA